MLYTLMPFLWGCHDRGVGGGLEGTRGKLPSPPSRAAGFRGCSSSRRPGLWMEEHVTRESEHRRPGRGAQVSLMPSNLGSHGRGSILAVMLRARVI